MRNSDFNPTTVDIHITVNPHPDPQRPDDDRFLAGEHEPIPIKPVPKPNPVPVDALVAPVESQSATYTVAFEMTLSQDISTDRFDRRCKALHLVSVNTDNEDQETRTKLRFPDDLTVLVSKDTSTPHTYDIVLSTTDNTLTVGVVRLRIKLDEVTTNGKPTVAIGYGKFE